MENCSRCHFRQLFISLALRKCKKDFTIPKIIPVQGFWPQKIKITRFNIGLCLNTHTPTRGVTGKFTGRLLRILVLRTSKFEAVQKSPNVFPKELADRPARISSLNDSIKSSETFSGLAA